nr:acyltransferase family protein [Ornithinimicrobium sp. HY1745]
MATALVLWANSDDLTGRGVWRIPGVQWLGDRSYSVYLWHWPLLLAASTLFEGHIVATVGAVLVTLALSEVTYRQVEQRFRFRASSPRATTSGRAPTRAVGVLVVATMVTGAGGLLLAAPRDDGTLTPPLAEATDDRFMEFYDGDCRPGIPDTDPLTCTYGDPQGSTRVLVVGDSHAVMWMPGLIAAGEGQGWRVDLQAKLSCAPIGVDIDLRGNPYTACAQWGRNVLHGIEVDPPDVVVLAMNPGYHIIGHEGEPSLALADALRSTVQQIRAAGPQVVLMGVTPRFPDSVPECLAAAADNPEDCQVTLPDAIPQNHWDSVTAGIDGAHVLDLTDIFCPDGACLTNADGILRWMDSNHMTATFARTLAPELRRHLTAVLNST